MKKFLGAVALALSLAAPAAAQIKVDGVRDAAYGATTAIVTFDRNAPDSNFDAPTSTTKYAAYSISLSSDANNVYGFFQVDPASKGANVGPFANLYFDLNPAANTGSDLGFEIGANGVTAFAPGRNGLPGFSTVLDASTYSVFAQGGTVEFALANSLFSQAIPGLIYDDPAQTFPANGQNVVLRLSQSFGYSVAGGPSYGDNRLGAVPVTSVNGAVPEPATWAMMIAGFALVGVALRRRSTGVIGTQRLA